MSEKGNRFNLHKLEHNTVLVSEKLYLREKHNIRARYTQYI